MRLRMILACFGLCATAGSAAADSTETVLHRFAGRQGGDGAFGGYESPTYGGLVADGLGNFYGTTLYGDNDTGNPTRCDDGNQPFACGTAFELSPPSAPGALWTETIIYSFGHSNRTDGTLPTGGLAIRDGVLYGSTMDSQRVGYGTIFQLTPPLRPGDPWTQTILHNFGRPHGTGPDGTVPNGSVVMDAAGNIYGTTQDGGDYGYGTVWELSPPSRPGNAWKEQILYSFGTASDDGHTPRGGVILDDSGNLYGTTYVGARGYGDLYELSPSGTGTWTHKLLYSFTGLSDGGQPVGSLAFNGPDIYGAGAGGVFQFSAGVSTVINPIQASAGVIFDTAGNLYGTAFTQGGFNLGSVFELSPSGTPGTWTLTTLYSFAGGLDGANPQSGVVFGQGADLFGLTNAGGISDCVAPVYGGCGVVFQIVN